MLRALYISCLLLKNYYHDADVLVNVIMLESVASKFYNSATFLLRGLTWLYVGEPMEFLKVAY